MPLQIKICDYSRNLRAIFYSVLNASTGLIATALLAGINPAKAPLKINTLNALIATDKSTVGFVNISPELPIAESNASNNPMPITKPK